MEYQLYNDEISTAGFAVYSSFGTVVKLTVKKRSKGDEINQKWFRTVLLNLRNGNSTLDDWNILLTRTLSNLNNVSNISEYVKLSFSNENIAKHNYEALECGYCTINARHDMAAASKLSPLGARGMLTRNLWTTRGLCNGSMGVIKDLVFQEGDHPSVLPIAVIVQFDESYTGPSICVNEPKCVPIVPQTNVSDLLGVSHERQQLPLKLSWVITTHKSQGFFFFFFFFSIQKIINYIMTHLKQN